MVSTGVDESHVLRFTIFCETTGLCRSPGKQIKSRPQFDSDHLAGKLRIILVRVFRIEINQTGRLAALAQALRSPNAAQKSVLIHE